MGAVMREVAHRYPTSVGAVGGAVGMVGGLGGFLLPQAAALVKGATGDPFTQVLPVLSLLFVAHALQLCYRTSKSNLVTTPA